MTDVKISNDNLRHLQEIIRGGEPVPGMFNFVTSLVKQTMQAEDRIARVFCERHGIALPSAKSFLGRRKALQHSVAIHRVTYQIPKDLPKEAEFIISQAWCVDIREDRNAKGMRWPMVVVSRRENTWRVAIHDPEGSSALYDDLVGSF